MRNLASGSWGDRPSNRGGRSRAPLVRYLRADFKQFDGLPEGFVPLRQLALDPAFAPLEDDLREARRELTHERNIKGLAALRLRLGMSQQELADAVGTSQPRLSTWEHGSERPGFDSLRKLRAALQVSYDELMDALDA